MNKRIRVAIFIMAGCAPLSANRAVYRDPQTGREHVCEQQETRDMVSTMEQRGNYIDCKNKMERSGYIRVQP
jgi:hypothetical protein